MKGGKSELSGDLWLIMQIAKSYYRVCLVSENFRGKEFFESFCWRKNYFKKENVS